MKIAVVTEILNTHSGSRAPIELAKHLANHHKISIIAYTFQRNRQLENGLNKLNINIKLIKSSPSFNAKLIAIPKLISYLKEENFDLISFHGTLPTFLACKLTSIPIVKTYYGTQLNGYLEKKLPSQKNSTADIFVNAFGNALILFSDKLQFWLSDKQVAISNYTAQEAHTLYGYDIPTIHLGANVLNKSKNKQTNRHPHLLSISRITPYKGFHFLIEAVKQIEKKRAKPIYLTIAGSSQNPYYLQYLKEIKTNHTQILPNISDQELSNLYKKCDLYITCDQYIFFGMPILEAALYGKPALALDYCAAREIIEHNKTGLVAKNTDQLKTHIMRLIHKKDLLISFGKAAKHRAETQFNWQKTAQAYITIFESILNEK